MNIQRLGTSYGGWSVSLDAVNDGDKVLDIGVGGDVSFAEELRRRKSVKIILVDPDEDCGKFVHLIPNSEFISGVVSTKDGILPLFISLTSSSSLCRDNRNVGLEHKLVRSFSIEGLIKRYQPSLVKLDIEGEEYSVLPYCIGVRQIAVEFHHRLLGNKTAGDTTEMLNMMALHKYDVIATGSHSEFTFLRKT